MLGKSDRVWIMRRMGNNLYHVSYLASISHSYHRAKNNCLGLIKSISALRNVIKMMDRGQTNDNVGESKVEDYRNTFLTHNKNDDLGKSVALRASMAPGNNQ